MNLILMRMPSKPDYTDGILLINGQFFGHTVEDTVRPVKIPGTTAIPKGVYSVSVERSPRFSEKAGYDVYLPHVHDVPGFEGVLIHGGNTAVDSLGCILVASNRVKPGVIQGSLANALTMKLQHGEGPHTLTIWESV